MSAKKDERSKGEFLAEAEDILEDLGSRLAEMDGMVGTGNFEPEVVNAIFRGVHTLKGLSGMFGFEGIAGLSHQLEHLLDALRLGKVDLTREATAAIYAALDRIRVLSEDIGREGAERSQTGDVSHLIEEALSASRVAGKKALTDELEIDQAMVSVLTEYEEHRLRENIKAGKSIYVVAARFELASFDKDLTSLNGRLKGLGEIISTLPSSGLSPAEGIEFNIILGSAHSEEELKEELASQRVRVSLLSRREQAKKSEGAQASVRSVSKTVRVDIGKLDSLMNIVGELVIGKNAVARVSRELRQMHGFTGLAVDLYKASRSLERKLGELQEGVIEVRMVPVGQIFTRLIQAVRKYAADSGKEVELEAIGGDTELDKVVVEEISDPLMHLIRNAIDHGVEPPGEREAKGKPPKGLIRLDAYPKGNRVVITVEDDGAGMDPDVIRRRAVEKGLVSDDADLTRRETIELIFLPGFSTKEKVSEVSGRGVGLDVVKKNVAKLSGVIDIETEAGAGTKVMLTLPITLAIIKALVVEVSTERFALPLQAVSECLAVDPGRIGTIERREVVTLRGETLPLVRLDRVFGLPGREGAGEVFVIVVGSGERRLGFVVDRLAGQQEVVIKSVGTKLKDVPGIAGACELGENEVVLVLDAESLINEATMRR